MLSGLYFVDNSIQYLREENNSIKKDREVYLKQKTLEVNT